MAEIVQASTSSTGYIGGTGGSGSNTSGGDAFWKSPILKKGEYDIWVHQMKIHVNSVDAQCWKIITQGDQLLLDKDNKLIPEANWDEAEYKKIERNNKALKLIIHGLSPGDQRKVMSHVTAKDKWDALKRLNEGGTDVKRDRISALYQQYDNLEMKDGEEIEDFHTRFTTIINNLSFLGETIENWRQVTKVLQSLNSQWDPVALSFQTQAHTTNLDVDDLFGKLSAFGGLQKRKQKSKQVPFDKNLALKIEKTLDYYHNGGEPID